MKAFILVMSFHASITSLLRHPLPVTPVWSCTYKLGIQPVLSTPFLYQPSYRIIATSFITSHHPGTISHISLNEVRRVGKPSEFLLHGLCQDTLHWRQYRCNAGEFRIEIAGICGAGNAWLKWRWQFLVSYVVPVDVSEEAVTHNLLCISRAGAEAKFRLSGQQFLQDGN